jgi:hypothetical protein
MISFVVDVDEVGCCCGDIAVGSPWASHLVLIGDRRPVHVDVAVGIQAPNSPSELSAFGLR